MNNYLFMDNIIVIQGIGFVGLFFAILEVQQKKRNKILAMHMLSLAMFVVHYILLGGWTAAVVTFIGILRLVIFIQRFEKDWARSKNWLYLFIIAFLLSGIATWKNAYSILPVGGMILGTLAYWSKKPFHTRLLILACTPLWTVYNIVFQSWPGLIGEFFILISTLIGIMRLDVKSKKLFPKEKAAEKVTLYHK
ncbi:hypothetical protein GF340_02185 [Candidatus Peregrinibacteria bacterium]|nr:hypothetical protein [Candidatus Peregrinibacteria bacterium]